MPTVEVGQVIPNVVKTTIYDWKWYYTAQGFAVWLVLIFALILPRSNRDLRVVLILVPLVIVNRVAMPLMKITGMISRSAIQMDTLLQSMAVAMAVLWLTSAFFNRFSGPVRFSLSLGIVMLVAALGTQSYFTEVSEEMVLSLASVSFLALAMLAAMISARAICDGAYRPVDFMVWLAACMLLGGVCATLALSVLSSGLSWVGFWRTFYRSTMTGMSLGLAVYMVNLPFMVLGFVNPFFRKRLCGCLRLQAAAARAMPSGADEA